MRFISLQKSMHVKDIIHSNILCYDVNVLSFIYVAFLIKLFVVETFGF